MSLEIYFEDKGCRLYEDNSDNLKDFNIGELSGEPYGEYMKKNSYESLPEEWKTYFSVECGDNIYDISLCSAHVIEKILHLNRGKIYISPMSMNHELYQNLNGGLDGGLDLKIMPEEEKITSLVKLFERRREFQQNMPNAVAVSKKFSISFTSEIVKKNVKISYYSPSKGVNIRVLENTGDFVHEILAEGLQQQLETERHYEYIENLEWVDMEVRKMVASMLFETRMNPFDNLQNTIVDGFDSMLERYGSLESLLIDFIKQLKSENEENYDLVFVTTKLSEKIFNAAGANPGKANAAGTNAAETNAAGTNSAEALYAKYVKVIVEDREDCFEIVLEG